MIIQQNKIRLANNTTILITDSYLKFKGFAAFLSLNGRKVSTIYRHLHNLDKLLLSAPNFTEPEIEDYFFSLKEKGRKNTYINSLVSTVRQYALFKGNKELTTLGFRKKEMFSKATMSDDEIQAFLELPAPVVRQKHYTGQTYMDRTMDPKGYQIWTVFFSIMAFTGMRPGEVAHLKIDDVDWGRGVFVIEDSKTNTPGVSPIPPNISAMVQRHIDSLKSGVKFLFGSKQGGKRIYESEAVVDNVDWHYNFHKRLERLGIKRKNLTPYSLRHSFATRLLESDVSLFHVKKLMHHNDLKSTLVYEHLTTKDLIRAVKKLPMVRFGSDPKLIIQDLALAVRAFELEDDPRFSFSITENGDSININVKIRNSNDRSKD